MIKCSGTGKVEVLRGGKCRFLHDGANTLLDNWFDRVSSFSGIGSMFYSAVFKVGHSLVPTTVDMTALQDPFVGEAPRLSHWAACTVVTENGAVTPDGNHFSAKIVATARFPAGSLKGSLGELGIEYDSGVADTGIAKIHARFQMKGADGQPMAVELDYDDELVLTHTITLTVPLSEVSNFTLTDAVNGDTQHTLTRRFVTNAINAPKLLEMTYGSNSSLASKTPSPADFVDVDKNASNSYLGNQITQVFTKVSAFVSTLKLTFPTGQANWTEGMATFKMYSTTLDVKKFDVNPPIVKTSANTVSLTVTRTLARG